MSSAARPSAQAPAGSRTGSASGAGAPAPTGILVKQSSFTKSKNPQASSSSTPSKTGSGANGAGASAAALAPSTRAVGPTATPQAGAARPAGAVAPSNGAAKGPAASPAAKTAAPPGMWGPNGEIAPNGAQQRPANGMQQGPFTMAGAPSAASPAMGNRAAPGGAASPAMGNRAAPGAASPAMGNRAAAAPAGGTRAAPAPATSPAAARPGAAAATTPGAMQRQGSFGGNAYGSMSAGQMGSQGAMPSAYGSMGPGQMPGQGYGSMGPGAMNSMGPQGYGSMGGAAMTPGSMGPGGYSMGPQGYGSMGPQGYGSMGPQGMGSMMAPGGMGSMMGPSGYGSMGPGMAGNGSMYGGSMMGGNSLFGSQFGSMGPGMMGGGAGSLYGMPGVNRSTSAYGFAAQWGSLANMSSAPDRSGISRSNISSSYGGFESEAKGYRMEDLCPNIGTLEEGKPVKRSGRRGGNHLYSRDKNDRSAAIITSNAKANTMTIKRDGVTGKSGAADDKKSPATGSSSTGAKSRGLPTPSGAGIGRGASDRKTADGKPRAKLPGNYDLHTLHVVDKASGSGGVQVRDPNTLVLEKDGKKETFETDEAIEREKPTEEVDSVLLSSVLTSWHGGHNSSLLVGAGKGKTSASVKLAHDFVKGAVERLEKTASSNYFDISINMVAIRSANQGCDLLKEGSSYNKLQLGSSPVYGPCLLGLETKVVKTAKDCVKALEDGVAASKDPKELIAAFLVLKQSKKGGDKEVRLSSLCLAYAGETITHYTDMKERSSSSPYQLFRYAIGGASVCVSALVIAADDPNARATLDVERKMREVKNRAPRSGNLQKFIEYTQKEITRMKDKAASASDSDKKRTEAQIKKMEDMIKDTQKILDDPESAKPTGYPLPS